jgi:transcriptional regulator with XRE-family HTH domain
MPEITYNIYASSDTALIKTLGAFIKHNRLQQNKTQSQLATEAGIVRSTLSLFERGENVSLIVFIQLLRSLQLLHLLQEFQIRRELSPLELAKLEQSKRQRVRQKDVEKKTPGRKSDW